MCLGVPGTVVEVKEVDGLRIAVVDVGGGSRIEAIVAVDTIAPGDRVIVHAGTVISKLSEDEYQNIVEVWNEILEALGKLGEGS